MNENWKEIAGYEGKYEVSNFGRVRSMPRIDTTGRHLPMRVQKLVIFNTNGHLRAALSWACKTKRESVHRLVLQTFLGPCPAGMQACHNDGNPKNNRIDNLRWDTPKANQFDRVKHETSNCGERGSCAKLKKDDVYRMRDMRICGAAYQEIATWFGVSLTTAHRAVTRQSWTFI